jgi:hypothetical protein
MNNEMEQRCHALCKQQEKTLLIMTLGVGVLAAVIIIYAKFVTFVCKQIINVFYYQPVNKMQLH